VSDPSPVPADRYYKPREVASIFRVDRKTVARWAAAGRIESIRTPGGHFLIPGSAVRQALAATSQSQVHR
jgi:excisionase family DNA binding protein